MTNKILSDKYIRQFDDAKFETLMGEVTYWRTYSRNLWDEKRKERWNETVGRVVNGVFEALRNHCVTNNRKWDNDRAKRTAVEMFHRILTFKFTPPGRGLYAMGTDAVTAHGGGVLNNCAFLSTRDPRPDVFAKLMNLTMLGVGVGYDTLGAGKAVIVPPNSGNIKYQYHDLITIEDTRQGWVDSVESLLYSYMSNGSVKEVRFDYSQIRPAGLPIKRFGGVSSGPEPLRRLHDSLRVLCDSYAGKRIDSTWIVDACNLIGRCVVAGNVRRSAQIALGQEGDREFLYLKEDFGKVAEYRAFSNNSLRAHVGMDYTEAAALTARTGEPGYFWLDNSRMFGRMNGQVSNRTDFLAMGTNPCSEQTLEDGELCCLVETYPAKHATLDDYLKTLKLAYLYAKAVTLVPTGMPETDEIIARNRRIGCSMSGVVQAIQKFGATEFLRWCNRGYDSLTGLDASYSDWLGVPESIKRTSVKPSGTVSILANASPGIHYPHSEYYIRRVRFASNSPILPQLKQAGYNVVPEVYGQELGKENTMVVEFPIHEPFFSKGKAQASMWEQLALTAAMQRYWADNQVSVTIHFTEAEAKDIPLALEIYQHQLKSVSFLPYDPHQVYKLAPYEEITKEHYEQLVSNLLEVVLPYDTVDVEQEAQPKGCDSDSCELPKK